MASSEPPRFYVPVEAGEGGTALAAGREVALPAGEAHHAAHVLRLRAGDAVVLFDGRGTAARGRIARIARGEAVVGVEEVGPTLAPPGPAIHLGFAVPKGRRLDWLLEKATELGVASLEPVLLARSVAGGREASEGKRDRWLGHVVSAAKQADLAHLPRLAPPASLAAFLEAHRADLGLYGEPSAEAATVPAALAGRRPGQAVALLVGPEGGLTEDERSAARAGGMAGVRLGRTTLRVETAAVALVAAVVAGTQGRTDR